ncbi:MAG: NAD(P) transhydrogenase subunit alpha [Actinomycetota bacterium]
MRVGVRKETADGERRVALVPDGVEKLHGVEVVVERGAGLRAGWTDDRFTEAGATVADGAAVAAADIVVGVHPPAGTGPATGATASAGPWHIALFDPLWNPEPVGLLAATGISAFSLDLVPRTTRAQSMDVLSSMATVAGYRAALLGAARLPRLFPMLMTAAGTLAPARVLVLGAGVAGLQAIATARRLGAVVHGYDVRPAAAEQIRSLGAKAIEEGAVDDIEDAGGYARAQTADDAARQRSLLGPFVEAADVLITTAAIPGRASPLLVTNDMVATMRPGTVVIDLAAERGGNVEPSVADTEVDHHGVLVLGPTRLTSEAADHASTMFSNNVVNLINHLVAEADGLDPDLSDEITAGMLVTHRGEVVHPMVKQALDVRAPT